MADAFKSCANKSYLEVVLTIGAKQKIGPPCLSNF